MHEIPRIVNANGGAILDNISESSVADYAVLKDQFRAINVSEDAAFQERFQDLYQFNSYRIKPSVRKKLFQVLEAVKTAEEIDIRQIALEVMSEVDLKNFRLKQFYVVSTILHTLDDKYPLFDKYSVSLFEFDSPAEKLVSNYRQMTLFIDHYDQLSQAYAQLLENDAMQDLLKVVKIKFYAHKAVLTPLKRMDLILRSAGELKQKDVLIRGARMAETA